ncbi:MAG: flagellin [Planctomycetota bacterium]|nr:flagellin [Planctomycetota bacterium]
MGLRINDTSGVLSSLRQLSLARLSQSSALEKMATGLAINRAGDNPSGLVISEILRSQLGATAQAIENTQFAANMVATAEAGMSEINNLMTGIRGQSLAIMNTGAMSPEAQMAAQMSIDMSLQAIDRIANTTRFAGTSLLNGAASFNISNAATQFEDIRVMAASLPASGPMTIDVAVQAAAQQATATGNIAPVQAGASTVQIRGSQGSVELNFAAGATQAEVMSAINATTSNTGVEAVGGQIRSVEYGSQEFVSFTVTQGAFSGITPGTYAGQDIQATVEGQPAQGIGNQVMVTTGGLTAELRMDAGTGPGTYTFDIVGGGLGFQLGTEGTAADQLRVGIEAMNVSRLGQPGALGNLGSLRSGGANSPMVNPANALEIVDSAINQVSTTRGHLGSVVQQQLQPNVSALQIAFENLSASESTIRDADMAQEAANAGRANILIEAAVLALRNANITQGGVLRLLR